MLLEKNENKKTYEIFVGFISPDNASETAYSVGVGNRFSLSVFGRVVFFKIDFSAKGKEGENVWSKGKLSIDNEDKSLSVHLLGLLRTNGEGAGVDLGETSGDGAGEISGECFWRKIGMGEDLGDDSLALSWSSCDKLRGKLLLIPASISAWALLLVFLTLTTDEKETDFDFWSLGGLPLTSMVSITFQWVAW